MEFWKSVGGRLRVELRCADPSYALTIMQNHGITAETVQIVDDFSISFSIGRMEMSTLKKMAEKRGFELKIVAYPGLYWLLPKLLHRPVLLIGMAIL